MKTPLRFAAGVLVAVMAAEVPARAETIVVSPAGPQRSIAAAVRAAASGDTIVVRPGTYREPPFVVDRPLSLVGEGEQETTTAAAKRSGTREYRMRRAPGTGELIRDREAQGSYQPRGPSASGEARPPR